MKTWYHTLQVAPESRVDFWRDAMVDSLSADCTVEPKRRTAFDARMDVLHCGEVDLLDIAGSPYKTLRHGPGRPEWVSLVFQLDGFAVFSDARREARLGPGDACVVPDDRELLADRQTAFRQLMLNVRAENLAEVLPGWRAMTSQRIDGAGPCAKATRELLRFIVGHHGALAPQAREQLGCTALQMLSGLQGSPVRRTSRRGDGVGAHTRQRQRAERFILENLHESQLSVDLIAQDLGISRRYLHSIFHDGLNVMQWVLEQRLQACHREVTVRGGRSIADVAYSWGFSSPQHFSHAFKKRFGVSASEL